MCPREFSIQISRKAIARLRGMRMPIRAKHSISILLAVAALTGKWVTATPAHDGVRFDVCETAALNGFAEAS